jgi:predicted enzyme related to lactoylglutathione lyase
MAHLFVNIDVPDIEAGARFYVQAFELTVGRRLEPDFIELLGAPVPLYLIAAKEGSSPSPHAKDKRTYQRHWTPVHFDLIVDDLEKAMERVLAAGAQLDAGITKHVWGRMAVFADPFGHGFCLLQMSERGYDALVDEDHAAGVAGVTSEPDW